MSNKPVFRQRVDSPLVIRWPRVSDATRTVLLDILRGFLDEECCFPEILSSGNAAARTPTTVLSAHPSASTFASTSACVSASISSPPTAGISSAVVKTRALRRRNKPVRVRCCLYSGVNEVTKALERRLIRPVGEADADDDIVGVVCALDVSPTVLTQHIPALCFRTKVPLLGVPAFSSELGSMVGATSAIVIGFRGAPRSEAKLGPRFKERPQAAYLQDCEYLRQTAEFVAMNAPPLEIPWLPNPRRPDEAQARVPGPPEIAAEEVPDNTHAVVLQPLRVDHVVMNTSSKPPPTKRPRA